MQNSPQEAQERQEKREQAKAERLASGGDGAAAQRDTREDAGGGGKAKRALGCNTCGLTFADTVRSDGIMYQQPASVFHLHAVPCCAVKCAF